MDLRLSGGALPDAVLVRVVEQRLGHVRQIDRTVDPAGEQRPSGEAEREEHQHDRRGRADRLDEAVPERDQRDRDGEVEEDRRHARAIL